MHLDFDLAPYVKKSFVKHFNHYYEDVLGWSEEDTKAYISAYGVIELDNKALEKELCDAYKYAVKQLNREGKQAAEGLYHNLNTLESRAGSQVPFTSINFGRDTSTEGRLVSEWMLHASLKGVGKHHLTPIFPISIFMYKDGVNAKKEDPNYDLKRLALESLSKRIYPKLIGA